MVQPCLPGHAEQVYPTRAREASQLRSQPIEVPPCALEVLDLESFRGKARPGEVEREK